MLTLLDKVSCIPITNISENDENFLKEFSKNIYQKIIDISDFNVFEITLSEWIKDISKNNIKTILELMQNYKKAFELYYESANNGHGGSQNNLGYCCQYGQGVDKDYKLAFEWYSKSANNGCGEGQNNLGYCYQNGQGTDKDYKKAFEW